MPKSKAQIQETAAPEDEDLEFDLDELDLDVDTDEDEDLDFDLDLDLDEDEDEDEDLDIDADDEDETLEENAASDTIKMNPSRSVAMASAISSMAAMSTEDLNKFAESIKKPGNPIPDGTAAKNVASVAMKTVTKEEIEELFGTGDDLSEEFREKTRTIFEAAVNSTVATQLMEVTEQLEERYQETVEALEEAYATTLEEEIATFTEGAMENIDAYLSYVAEQWAQENELVLERSLRAEIAEGFIEKVRDLFIEHNLEIPEEAVDALEEATETIENLKSRLDEVLNENISLKSGKLVEEANELVENAVDGLPGSRADKIRQLAEGIDFNNIESFKSKLNIIVESVATPTTKKTGILTEEAPAVDENELNEEKVMPKSNDPRINTYAEAISKMAPKAA